jgi:hypothetical protein
MYLAERELLNEVRNNERLYMVIIREVPKRREIKTIKSGLANLSLYTP